MRQIGILSNRAEASKFAAYLVVQGIPAQSEEDKAGWAVWVRDEDQLVAARAALVEFQADPANAKFQGIEQTAEQRKRDEAAKREAARQNVVTMGQRWRGPGSARHRPLTIAVILICGTIAIFTNMGLDRDGPLLGKLLFCGNAQSTSGWNPDVFQDKLVELRRGQFWRILTPAFVHYGAMHLAFNMVMFYHLASLIEHRRGTTALALLMLAIAVPSNLAQALVPVAWGGSVYFGGLSGVVFGLFGYLWMKSRFDPASGLFINRNTVIMLLIFLGLGMLHFFNVGNVRIANWAHGVGFVTGLLIGWVPIAIRSVSRS